MASERFQRRIDRLLNQIEESVDQLNWEVVLERAQAVLAIDPENQDALTFLAAGERVQASSASSASKGSDSSPSPMPSAATPDLPTSFDNGRYEVKRFLGKGGKKEVYLAQDTSLDREVAFAPIKTEGLDEVSRTRITREAQAMGRLGSIPTSVPHSDLGGMKASLTWSPN